MRLAILPIVLAIALSGCKEDAATTPQAIAQDVTSSASPPRAVVNTQLGMTQERDDPFLRALRAQPDLPPAQLQPSSESASPPQPVAPGPSALDIVRMNATSPDAMAASLRQFAGAATAEEQQMIRQAILVALMHTQQQLTVEASAGRQVALDEQSLFVRTFGQFNGKTFRQVYLQMAPLIPAMQQAYLQSQATPPAPTP